MSSSATPRRGISVVRANSGSCGSARPIDPADYHVAFTTPYILMGFGKADWTAYLSKSLIGLTAPEKRRRLHELLKYGREPNFWSEFIFKAYLNHRPDAIFLTGLPDVPGSMPHA